MKKLTFLFALLGTAVTFAQFPGTSFEEPEAFSVEYVDTGDANTAHDLINNPGEPFVDFPETNQEMGYNARYVPYDTPSDGLTDGDPVGVTDFTGTVGGYSDGTQGYRISDTDGNFILEFDIIESTSTGPVMFVDFFISETGYEGDGTVNEPGSDRLRIYVKDLSNNVEFDLIDTTGNDINDLNIEGTWITAQAELTPYNGTPILFQLVIEARNNSEAESFYFDNIFLNDALSVKDRQPNEFAIAPNPVVNGMAAISSGIPGTIEVEIYDILGKLLFISSMENNTLDVSHLNSGIYMLKLSQQGYTQTKKLVIR